MYETDGRTEMKAEDQGINLRGGEKMHNFFLPFIIITLCPDRPAGLYLMKQKVK